MKKAPVIQPNKSIKKDFFDSKEIDVPLLKSYIYEAVLIDAEKAKMKRVRK